RASRAGPGRVDRADEGADQAALARSAARAPAAPAGRGNRRRRSRPGGPGAVADRMGQPRRMRTRRHARVGDTDRRASPGIQRPRDPAPGRPVAACRPPRFGRRVDRRVRRRRGDPRPPRRDCGDVVDRQGRRISMTRARLAEAQRVVVLVKRFPRLSETFILNEFLELRRHGLPVELFAIMDPHERSSQPEALALVPEVTYIQTGRLWAGLPAALRAARRHPRGTLRAVGFTLSRHSRAAARNLLHALVLLDRLADGPPAHLHAHFLHSPAALAFVAAKVSGQPYSLTGHAKDIYTTLPENLRMRCDRARFVTTCTEANRAHLITEVGLAPGQVHVCRHGVDLTKFTIPARTPRPGRIVSVGRLVPKKGFDILIRACGEPRPRGEPFELVRPGRGAASASSSSCWAGASCTTSSWRSHTSRESATGSGCSAAGHSVTSSSSSPQRRSSRSPPWSCPTAIETASRTCCSRQWRPACRS